MRLGRVGLSPVMIGRNGALRRLQTLVSGGRTEAVVALAAGEGGIGKTRLVQELLGSLPDAAARSEHVLIVRAEPGSLGRPFDALRPALGQLGLAEADPIDGILAWARTEGRVAVFEDLHWADADTVSVFERLATADDHTMAVIGTYRPEELSRRTPFGEALARVERRRSVAHFHLDRLSRLDVQSFLTAVFRSPVPPRVVARLFERTGGNPFFLEEILLSAGEVPPEELVDAPLPWSLAELVRGQLDGLGPLERRVVDAVAVLGHHADFDILARVVGIDEDELERVLRGLVDRGLVFEASDDRFAFRHALLRDAVASALLGRERRRLHLAALEAMRDDCCADLAALAHHAHGAGRFDELVDLARDGVRYYLERGSTFQAYQLAELALAEAPDDVELLAGAARAAWMLSLNEDALAHARRWRDATAHLGAAQRVEVQCMLLRLAWERSDTEAMDDERASLERLVEQLGPSEQQARASAQIAQAYMLTGRPIEAVEWADRAVDLADAVGAKHARAQALVEKGTALAEVLERRAEGEAILRTGIAEAEAIGDDVLVTRGLYNLSGYVSLHTPAGREVAARWFETANRAGFDPAGSSRWSQRIVEVALSEADMPAAIEALEQMMRLRRTDGFEHGWYMAISSSVARARGDLDEARADLAGDLSVVYSKAQAWRACEYLLIADAAGDSGAVADAYEALVAHESWCNPGYGESVLAPVMAAVRHGVPTARVRADLDARGVTQDAPWWPIVAGLLAAGEGRAEEAVELVSAGLARGDDVALPQHLRAQVELDLAHRLVALGRRADALALAHAARTRLANWPGPLRDSVDACIGRLEGAADRRADVAELTVREREVATLVAEGCSNAELARRLFISPKTAAVHVSNILAKLAMANRSEIAAWAVRQGLGPDKSSLGGPDSSSSART